VFDIAGIYAAVKTGGPPVIFVLLLVIGLIITRVLQVKTTVDHEAEVVAKLNADALAARDRQIVDLVQRLATQQLAFDTALMLIRSDFVPMLREALGRRGRS
jgi:hypothetical protein